MNFLWNKQVLGFIFILKNPISNSFNQLNSVLDWASIPGKFRGLGVIILDTENSRAGLRVGFSKA
jgi:hypothetical protein